MYKFWRVREVRSVGEQQGLGLLVLCFGPSSVVSIFDRASPEM